MSNYTRGRSFEYEIKHLFESAGYTVVRAAGSHSPFDLVAIKEGRKNRKVQLVVLAQCKYGESELD